MSAACDGRGHHLFVFNTILQVPRTIILQKHQELSWPVQIVKFCHALNFFLHEAGHCIVLFFVFFCVFCCAQNIYKLNLRN